MKRIVLILFMIQGILMAATLQHITVKDTKIPLIFAQDRTLPIRSMQLVFKGGGKLFEDKPSLARFSAKVLSEGTKSKGATAFARELEKYAISLSVNNGNETFVLELTALKEYFDKGLELTKELLQDPNLSDEAMQKVTTNYKGSLAQRQSDYDYLASRELKGLIYDAPLDHYATPKDIDAITKEGVKNFLNENLVLENVIVLMGGDMDTDQAKEYAAALLSQLQPGSAFTIPRFEAKDTAQKKIQHKPSDQAYIYFIAPLRGVSKEQEYLAKVASFILGSSGFGSRLMEEIRVKRGLAYSVYSRFVTNLSHSYFTGHLQTKIASADEAIDVVEEQIKKFVEKGATKEELEDAKKFLQGSDPLRRETLMQRISIAFNEFYKGKELGYSQTELEKIQNLDLETLNAFIKRHDEIANLSYSIVTAEQK